MSVYKGIMQGLTEALEHAEGKSTLRSNAVSIAPVRVYGSDEIKQIRQELGMTQSVFARFMGVSQKTVEAWEAGRNQPDGPARRILSMIQEDPTIPEKYHIISTTIA